MSNKKHKKFTCTYPDPHTHCTYPLTPICIIMHTPMHAGPHPQHFGIHLPTPIYQLVLHTRFHPHTPKHTLTHLPKLRKILIKKQDLDSPKTFEANRNIQYLKILLCIIALVCTQLSFAIFKIFIYLTLHAFSK